MTIRSSLTAVASLVRDSPACPRWQARCKEARGLKIVSPREMYVYQVNRLPWPIANRDVVAHVRWRQDPDTLAVYMTATSVTGMFPPQKGLVRVPEADTHWTFYPKGEGKVEVITETHVDPGGPIPAWFVNMMMVSLPYKTMENMRRIVATGAYNDAKIGFIKEPVSSDKTQQPD